MALTQSVSLIRISSVSWAFILKWQVLPSLATTSMTSIPLPLSCQESRLFSHSSKSLKSINCWVNNMFLFFCWMTWIYSIYYSILQLKDIWAVSNLGLLQITLGFPAGTSNKESFQCKGRGFNPWVRKISWKKQMATHFSILVWKIPSTEEPGRL